MNRFVQATDGFARNRQAIIAGHLAFVGLVSLFPFLIVLVTIAGVVGSTEAATAALKTALASVPLEIAHAVGPVAAQIMQAPQGGALTLGLLAALWAASAGFEALRLAFNDAYGVGSPRQLWVRRLQSILLTLVFATAVVIATLGIVVVPIVVSVAASILQYPDWQEAGNRLVSDALGASCLVLATAAIYKFLPRPRLTFLEVLPGAILAVVAWFVLARLFGYYLAEIATLSITYGSLGGVVATLIFFYLTACVVLFGCEFNAAAYRARREQA